MRINGPAAYSTVIASVNNRNATLVAAPSQPPLEENQKNSDKTVRSLPLEQQSALSATVEKSGRTATLSPHIMNKNLPPHTRDALNIYVNIQNQLHFNEQHPNQQLLGIDLFA